MATSQPKARYQQYLRCHHQHARSRFNLSSGWLTTFPNSWQDCWNLEPIRELLKDKVPFNWGPEHQAAFKQIKKEIFRAPILAYYNPKKETTLQTDASIKGLGACLLQDQKPVHFVSKALMDTQHGYVALEIKSLAVAWAMEKFNHFLYASHFILEMDQKPLEVYIVQKSEPSNT